MKLITIFNYPNNHNYNKLCEWWLKNAIKNSDIPIEVWYENELHINVENVTAYKKNTIDISSLHQNMVTDKSKHNVGFKLYNLCQETEPFIFVDADAIILRNLKPLIIASKDKPYIAIDHQKIVGHTSHLNYDFLNSGVQIVSDPSILNFDKIIDTNKNINNYACPGTDQALLFKYFRDINYDYTHTNIGYEWNNCPASGMELKDIGINHYWFQFKPWQINCQLWNQFI